MGSVRRLNQSEGNPLWSYDDSDGMLVVKVLSGVPVFRKVTINWSPSTNTPNPLRLGPQPDPLLDLSPAKPSMNRSGLARLSVWPPANERRTICCPADTCYPGVVTYATKATHSVNEVGGMLVPKLEKSHQKNHTADYKFITLECTKSPTHSPSHYFRLYVILHIFNLPFNSFHWLTCCRLQNC